MVRPLFAHVCAIAGLIILAVIYAWPLLSKLTVSIPATPPFADVTEYVWSTGWVAEALTHHKSLFYTDALFFPFGADLRLNTFGLLQGLLAFPVTRILGVVGAYNLVLVATLAMNGIAGYLLAFDVVRNVQASFISSFLFMLTAPVLQHIILGRSALGSMWLVAGSLLAFRRTIARPSARNALLLGVLLIGALVTDFQILLFCTLWLVLYCLALLVKLRFRFFGRSQVFFLCLAAVEVGLVFMALYAPVFSARSLSNYPQPSLRDMSVYSFGWWDFVMPDSIPYVYGYEFGVMVFLAVATFRWRGEYRLWLIGALFFAVLALGPFLRPTKVPLPFAGFSFLPGLGQFRTPYRMMMPAQIGLMIVAGSVLLHWLPRVRSTSLSWIFAGTLAIACLLQASSFQPFYTQVYPDYSFYHRVAREPGEFTLLEVPFGIRSGLERIGNGGEVVQYYQHIHRKRLLNGSMARVPSRVFQYYREQPALVCLSGKSAGVTDSELDYSFADVLGWSNARYVLLHRRLMTGDEYVRIMSFLNRQVRVKPIGEENDLVIYQVTSN